MELGLRAKRTWELLDVLGKPEGIKIEILELGSHCVLKPYWRSEADSLGGQNARSAAQRPCPWKLASPLSFLLLTDPVSKI